MKLLKIKAQGFKSFADKIEINIDNGITGVVGPNGSGKSNIVDAVRWVLGEQSVKALRGDSSMSDVIFSGSKTREGHNRCYVSLTFDNKDHYLSSEFEEIEIKRVLYKTGENDFFINNTKVRLKDITNLFLDSGASKESFNIISQGNVKDIINSKPEERRVIFESAAGVLTYKKRKEETTRKIIKTNDNIEKLDLLLEELKVTLEPLEVQAIKAKRYNEIYEELKKDEIALITHDITNLNKLYTDTQNKINNLNDEIIKYQTSNTSSNVKRENLKLKQIKIDENINTLTDNINKLVSKLSELKSEKQIAIERQKYEINNEKLESNIIELKENKLKLESDISILEQKEKNLNETKENLEKEKENLLNERDNNELKLNNLNTNLLKSNKEREYTKNRIEIINSNIENNNYAPLSVRSILQNKNLRGIHNTIGNLIDVDEKYTNAINVSLASSTNFIVVDNEESAKEAINYLKSMKSGRATFFPLNVIKSRYISSDILDICKKSNGFINIASKLIKYNEKYKNIIENQLGNIIVVDTLANAQSLSKKIDYKLRVVTLDGEIIHQGGSLTGGTLKQNTIVKEKQELEKEKDNLEKIMLNEKNILNQINDLNKIKDDLTTKINLLVEDLIKNISEIDKTKEFINDDKTKLLEINSELNGISSINDDSSNNIDKIMNEYYKVEKELKLKQNDLNELKDLKNNITLEINDFENQISKENNQYFKLQQSLKQNEIDISKYEIKLDNALNLLSEEYSLTYEKAKMDYILTDDENKVRNNVKKLKSNIKTLGEVNLASIAEYERINERYTFLNNQREDLTNAITNLEGIIKEMDDIMTKKIADTFEEVRVEFQKIFKGMFKGGHGDLILTNKEDILNTGIDIIAEPPGKKLSSIGLLSGGEKTITAIALLFAIINVKTVPFCILDEVEESLDEANVDIFGKYLQTKKEQSQFIIITHKKRTMEYADVLYGITMQESGVSKLVSVKLDNIK